MALAVRREMRRAGWGARRSGFGDCEVEPGRGACSLNLTTRGGGRAGSTDRGRSKLGVRRRLGAALAVELEARERLCCVR